jgi:hypothetical protein
MGSDDVTEEQAAPVDEDLVAQIKALMGEVSDLREQVTAQSQRKTPEEVRWERVNHVPPPGAGAGVREAPKAWSGEKPWRVEREERQDAWREERKAALAAKEARMLAAYEADLPRRTRIEKKIARLSAEERAARERVSELSGEIDALRRQL